MAILKCKMCGGDLNLQEGATTAECEYCGSVQTIPKVDDEKKLALFARANRLRAACDFDKAAGIYEAIVGDFPEEAEAYWGLVLCQYGIEYVDDPSTGKKIPTCHRSGFDSVMKDPNVELAQEYADVLARRLYREEAKAIEELRKNIIAVSANEEPYDVFICYKETDHYGKRTLDSVLAMDIYEALTDKNYRTFFSRVSLEDKLGTDYEPYIFAALNSAKIMLVIGTDFEYFNAVWVKNEWSRFLKLMAQDKQKHLIPCYKGIDAYDMPEEFARLQAQDLNKMGAIQDILRGVEKLLPKSQVSSVPVAVAQTAQPTVESYLNRAFIFLEDGDWEKAENYCEKTLDIDAQNPSAYLGKLMADLEVKTESQLAEQAEPFDNNGNYQKALRYADENMRCRLESYLAAVIERKETARMNAIYLNAKKAMMPKTTSAYEAAAQLYASIPQYKDAATLAQECHVLAQKVHNDQHYETGCTAMQRPKAASIEAAIKAFLSIPGWKDADEKLRQCRILLEQYKAKEEAERIEARKNAEEKALAREKTVKRLAELRQKWSQVDSLYSVGRCHIAALKTDGTVVATGGNTTGQLNVYGWHQIVALAAGSTRTFGLRKNGTVAVTTYTGSSYDYLNDVAGWRDVTAFSAAGHIVALKKDGTVLAAGSNGCDHTSKKKPCQVSDWTNIAKIQAGSGFTIGITKNGTVQAVGTDDNLAFYENQAIVDVCDCDKYRAALLKDGSVVFLQKSFKKERIQPPEWRNIIQLAAGGDFILGLRDDGTAVILGQPLFTRLQVDTWTDIVAIAASYKHAVGLKADGTVIATGSNTYGQLAVDDWTDIVSIGANWEHIFGIKADGTVVVSGDDKKIKYNVSHWKLFSSIDTIEEERAFAEKQAQWRASALCQHCGGQLKGLFSKKCVSCGKPKNY